MSWAHSPTPTARNIGPELDCDICSVVRANFLQLHPLIAPLSVKVFRTEKCQMFLTLQARSIEADSNILRLEISWDGQWADDMTDMARHLVVRPAKIDGAN